MTQGDSIIQCVDNSIRDTNIVAMTKNEQPTDLRSSRERGLRERALRQAVGLPAKITELPVPIQTDTAVEICQWPVCLPWDFVSETNNKIFSV